MSTKIVFVFGVFVVLVATLLWWLARPLTRPHAPQVPSPLPQAATAPIAEAKPEDAYPQVSLQSRSKEEAVRIFNENAHRDSRYEWKVGIRFYGKVVDQYGAPVAAGSVHLQWVNLQGEHGVGETQVVTDSDGRFALEGVRGKRLLVLKIKKAGFYDASPSDNQTSFEFANPAEEIFYEPDPDKPVVFLLRKKGESQPLIAKTVELRLDGRGGTGTVDLPTGKVLPLGGQLEVTVWKPTITAEQINARKVFPFDWRIQVRVKDGGLAEHRDAFALEAPGSGYSAEFNANLHPTNGASADMTVDKQFYFYFGQPRKYGRFHLRTDGDRPYVFIDYSFNPSGSRNLEYEANGAP